MASRLRNRYLFTTRQKLLAALVALVLVGVPLGWGIDKWTTPEDRSCAPGVERPQGSDECVGVNGSGFAFGVPQLAEIAGLIGHENGVLKEGKYVTVAILLPFTSTDPGMRAKVLHELQGSYARQYWENNKANGRTPKIRLVLANTGNENVHWERVVQQLKGMTGAPDRLRAVSGVATSSPEIRSSVAALTKAKIAVVGTTITADDIANGPDHNDFPGLARVSPTNNDEARALPLGKVDAGRTLIVQDTRTDDHYTNTLKAAFATALKGRTPYEPAVFTSPPDSTAEGTTSNIFNKIASRVCETQSETVLFAGRHTQLRQFINELGERGCAARSSVTVLTGDEGSYLGSDPKLDRKALTARLTVRYAALAHPDAWRAATNPTLPKTGGSEADYDTFLEAVSHASQKPVPLGDGQAIIAYDAVATAVHAIREAAQGKPYPEPSDVGQQWPQVTGELQRVNGASGWICLDNYGNPFNKAVPIVSLTPKGTQRFESIAWPEGKAPTPNCLKPNPQ
ncbi:hypothetical protein AB0C52_06590 [Streptomyces sp. NPDC048717]|uniref:hypothetical protein n=1 Tax=unclassified Streptomyces TaxID=2593676 RepID=UPI00344191B6